MIKIEVKFMEENKENLPQNEAAAEETTGYVPRPAWQVWGARIGLVLFIIVMLSRILRMAQGVF